VERPKFPRPARNFQVRTVDYGSTRPGHYWQENQHGELSRGKCGGLLLIRRTENWVPYYAYCYCHDSDVAAIPKQVRPGKNAPGQTQFEFNHSPPKFAMNTNSEGTNNSPENTRSEPYDTFKNLRLPQDGLKLPVKKHITSVSVRKPGKHKYFRMHPDYSGEVYLYVDKGDDNADEDVYLLDSLFAESLTNDALEMFQPFRLHLVIERHAEIPFIWPIRILIGCEEKDNRWWSSPRALAEDAKTNWISIRAKEGQYISRPANKKLLEPVWPDMPFPELVRLAFVGKVIDNAEHPILKQLLGEV